MRRSHSIETADVRAAYLWACDLEVRAPKPGNVYDGAPAADMDADTFRRSAEASAPDVCNPALPLGAAIRRAAEATRTAVGVNTNLGILMLCVPLVRVVPRLPTPAHGHALTLDDVGAEARVLVRAGGVEDTQGVFDAIATLAPAGLGDAPEHDAREPARARLLEVMAAAAERDTIASEYVTGFAHTRRLAASDDLQRAADPATPADEAELHVVGAYLNLLAERPDAHIARKSGTSVADSVRADATLVARRFHGTADAPGRLRLARAFDAQLKLQNLNPGTSADLIVAALLLARLFRSRP